MKSLNPYDVARCFGNTLHKQFSLFLTMAAFFLAGFSLQAQGPPCYLEGFTLKGVYNGHIYFLSDFTESGPGAVIAAAATGGHLVTIADEEENNFVASIAGGEWAWIGFNDVAVEGDFVWETGEPVTYTNWWTEGEPNNCCGGEHWTTTNWGFFGGWNDLYDGVFDGVTYLLPFVVEFDNLGFCEAGIEVSCWYQDADGDGFGNPDVTQGACTQPAGYVSDNSDCNDGDNDVNPDGLEICNGLDDNCDGFTDLDNPQGDWMLQNPQTSATFRAYSAMAYIGDDKVLVFGGYIDEFVGSDETWVYDLSDNNWTELNPTTRPAGRYQHALAYIGGDRVLLYGGFNAGTDTWIFDLSDNTWTLKNPATNPSSRYELAMATIGNDQVLLFGGIGSDGFGGTGTWVYDLSEDAWIEKSPETEPAFQFTFAMASVGCDKVLMFSSWPADPETWVYDLSDDNWTLQNTTTTPSSRSYHQMASLGGDQVVMFGGVDWPNLIAFGDTWIYDLSDNAWSLKISSPAPRLGHAMAYIGGGKAVTWGGYDYNPDWIVYSETWSYTAPDDLCSIPIACSIPIVSAGPDEHLYFGYGPGQCKTKAAVVTEGTAPFSYSWSLDRDLLLNVINESGDETMTGINTASVTVCLLDTAELCVTVTDANGNTATDCATMFGEDVRCFSGNNEKVNVCHNGNTICIDDNALDAHLAHGDYVGTCNGNIQKPGDTHNEGHAMVDNLQPGFSVYPNPTNGDFKINLDHTGPGIINIIDWNGHVTKRFLVGEQKQLDINLIEPGVYLIQLVTDRQILTRKIMVVH